MARRIALILWAFGFASSGAFAQQPGNTASEPAEGLKALADSCTARKFETMVVIDGSGRAKRVKICGKPGQTDAQWLVTLKDSARKVEADKDMAKAMKDQILTALKAEIDSLESVASTPVVAAPVATTARTPMASAPMVPMELANTPVAVPEARAQYSAVPPLPAPKPRLAGNASTAPAAAVARPRLTIRCALPRESFADCARLERETQLLIRADESLAGGVSVRFLRGGDERAELDLGPLHKGASLREKLPARVCSGVMRGKVQFQILSKGQVAETLGPYALYCGS